MSPPVFMVIPMGSHSEDLPETMVWVITTLAGGVIVPPPLIAALVNSTTEPEQAGGTATLSCSLVIHMLPLLSNRIPHGLLMLASPPGGGILVVRVVAIAGVDVPAAALTTAAAISTMVLPWLLFTHRFPLASKAIPSGASKAPGPTAGLVNTAAGVPENEVPLPNCA